MIGGCGAQDRMRSRRCSLAGFLIMTVAATAASAQVRVYAQVDTDGDIYVGDNFGYYVVIAGSDKAGQVDLEPLRQYNPRSTGNRKQSSTNIVGNQVTTTTTMIMTYALTVNQAGRVELPSVSVELDGKTYRTNPVTLNVIKPGTTDRLDVEMTLSEQECFVGQPVLLTINFYYPGDIKNTQFNIPVLGSDAFYFENPDTGNQQAQEYDLGTGVTVLVSQLEAMHNGRRSNLIVMRKILIPKTAGRIRIEPTAVSADVAVGRVRSRGTFDSFFGSQVRYQRFMVQSDPIELTVSPLPEEGRPDQFYGLVGQYTIETSASPTRVSVGDPITLTVKIGGGAYLKPVRWPELEQVPDLAANFKIPSQRASPVIADGFKLFTQTIRANNDKVTEIPSIPLAYFDADKGRYVTAQSEPIKLDVAPTKILTNADFGRAILNYRRAEMLDKSDTNIQKNLAFARSKRIDTVPVKTEERIMQTLFFWHYDFSLRTKFLIASICFAVACAALTVMTWRARAASLVATAAICGMLTVCFLTSVVVESRARANRVGGVITAEEIVARQGDGRNYPESFKEPLHAGTEFDLVERRQGWLHVRLSDNSHGWIPDNAAELI